MSAKSIHIVLFFTRGVSLKTWANNGSLNREIALYLRLQEKGVKVSFVTYGNASDLQFSAELKGIQILSNRWGLPGKMYEKMIPWVHAHALMKSDIVKSNQTFGSEIAFRAARLWRKPFIARCGFLMSEWAEYNGKFTTAQQARRIERVVFPGAQRVVVSAPRMKEYIIQQYGVPSSSVHVIPNYVLTDIFSPEANKAEYNRICYVGRLSEEKNLLSLVEASAGLDVDLHFVGEGNLRDPLQEKARELHVQLTLHGSLPHHQLPPIIRQSAIFAQVSLHEGHPKSLLEAMSCGAAVLGSNSPGIREQIVHGETGWLVGTDVKSIRAGIQHLLADTPLREKLGTNARRFILENYSLDKIVDMEYSLLRDIMDHPEG